MLRAIADDAIVRVSAKLSDVCQSCLQQSFFQDPKQRRIEQGPSNQAFSLN